MARFVAKYEKYRHGVRTGREMVLADGQHQEITRHLQADFKKGMGFLTEDEIRFGIENLNHTGLPIDKNTETHFSARHRLSGFDSYLAQAENGWTDEERELVETTLRSSGLNGQDFIELPVVSVATPWPTYNETPSAKIVEIAKAIGVPLESVLAYEQQNRNDSAVVFLIEDALANTDASEEDAPVVIEA